MSPSEAPATAGAVAAVVRQAIGVVLEVDPAQVGADDELAADLGADSLALIEIAEIVEADLQHAVAIPDEELAAFRTVGDLTGYLAARL